MTSATLAQAERAQLCDLLDSLGPDAPTLCEGWNTRDLTAHLVIREGRPDAGAGILVKPLERWTEKVQADAAAKPYGTLVQRVRTGPPRLSVFALPGVDALASTLEYFVHHEDVRRAQPDWQPRELDDSVRTELWHRLKASKRMLFRTAPVPVVLQPTDLPDFELTQPPRGSVVIRGPVAELVMHSYGRDAVRDVKVLGDPADVEAYQAVKLGF
ncbi:MAG: TIGR03085 family protein [Actinobacteria bacterium]|nr:TIGR03085 family protein [Actinomycetota bacterium]